MAQDKEQVSFVFNNSLFFLLWIRFVLVKLKLLKPHLSQWVRHTVNLTRGLHSTDKGVRSDFASPISSDTRVLDSFQISWPSPTFSLPFLSFSLSLLL